MRRAVADVLGRSSAWSPRRKVEKGNVWLYMFSRSSKGRRKNGKDLLAKDFVGIGMMPGLILSRSCECPGWASGSSVSERVEENKARMIGTDIYGAVLCLLTGTLLKVSTISIKTDHVVCGGNNERNENIGSIHPAILAMAVFQFFAQFSFSTYRCNPLSTCCTNAVQAHITLQWQDDGLRVRAIWIV